VGGTINHGTPYLAVLEVQLWYHARSTTVHCDNKGKKRTQGMCIRLMVCGKFFPMVFIVFKHSIL